MRPPYGYWIPICSYAIESVDVDSILKLLNYSSSHGCDLMAGSGHFEALTQSRVPLKTRREEQLLQVKYVDSQSLHVGLMWKFGEGMRAQMSSSLFDRGSKLRCCQ
ncbi:hypothetical protein TNCV_3393661 [Trichonephila clavipes]|nr:hypothetical protein TNCV_3393661 [Trichonephila clavipes]